MGCCLTPESLNKANYIFKFTQLDFCSFNGKDRNRARYRQLNQGLRSFFLHILSLNVAFILLFYRVALSMPVDHPHSCFFQLSVYIRWGLLLDQFGLVQGWALMDGFGSCIHLLDQSLDLTSEVLVLAAPTRKSQLGIWEGIGGITTGEFLECGDISATSVGDIAQRTEEPKL